MSESSRYAVITPYHREERGMLKRCIDSVERQTVAADHFLVADGFPQDWIDGERVRHLRLDRAHGDNGNTPRGVGALLAAGERYDGIALLDADNWLEPDHVEVCLAAARSTNRGLCDLVIARRNFLRPDETIMAVKDEGIDVHVDTSCFFFLRGSYHTLPIWALMPKKASPVCDRVFYQAIRQRRLIVAVTRRPTVNFHCRYESPYRALGEQPPPDAKPNASGRAFVDWLGTLSDRDLEIESRLAGGPLARPPRKPTQR
jgi:glycosyltransferase involved in cell wall biosynthesis